VYESEKETDDKSRGASTSEAKFRAPAVRDSTKMQRSGRTRRRQIWEIGGRKALNCGPGEKKKMERGAKGRRMEKKANAEKRQKAQVADLFAGIACLP